MRVSARLALAAAIAGTAALLMACAELDQLIGPPKNNKPSGTSSGPDPLKDISALADSTDSKIKNVKDSLDNISMKDERAVGQASAFKVISESGGLLLDSKLVDYVNEVGNAVAASGKRRPMGEGKPRRTQSRRFFFGVVDDDSMNAYSLPGGYIILTRGLMEGLSSESDLAFVLGHEVVHVDEEHNLTALKAQVGTTSAIRESGILGKPTGNPDAKAGSPFDDPEFFATIVTKATDIALKYGFGAGQEREADKKGLEYAIAAGYDAHGADRALSVLGANGAKRRTFLTAHDTPEQRIAALREAIDKAPPGKTGEERFEKVGFNALQMARAEKAQQAKNELPK